VVSFNSGHPVYKKASSFVGDSISSCFRDIGLYAYWGHEFDLSESQLTCNHLIPHRPFPIDNPLKPRLRFPIYSKANVTQWFTWP